MSALGIVRWDVCSMHMALEHAWHWNMSGLYGLPTGVAWIATRSARPNPMHSK